MTTGNMTTDTADIAIDRPADDVFAFMADPANLDLWSFGTWRIERDDSGLVRGKSIMSGAPISVKIVAHRAQRLIDYFIGASADDLTPRIFVRVIPGSALGGTDDASVLMMVALRGDGMDDDRWQGLKDSHAFEVRLIKSLIETGYDHRNEPR